MYRADAAPPSGGERHRSRRQPQPQPEDEQPPYDATEESPRPSFSTIDPAMDPQGPPPHRRPRDRSSKNSPKPEPEVQEPPPPAPRGTAAARTHLSLSPRSRSHHPLLHAGRAVSRRFLQTAARRLRARATDDTPREGRRAAVVKYARADRGPIRLGAPPRSRRRMTSRCPQC